MFLGRKLVDGFKTTLHLLFVYRRIQSRFLLMIGTEEIRSFTDSGLAQLLDCIIFDFFRRTFFILLRNITSVFCDVSVEFPTGMRGWALDRSNDIRTSFDIPKNDFLFPTTDGKDYSIDRIAVFSIKDENVSRSSQLRVEEIRRFFEK